MAKKQKLNLTEELTIHKSDFKIWPIEQVQIKEDYRPREEPVKKSPPPFVRLDIQSHAPCNSSVHIPFDLYLERKPIVKTDPRECFELKKPLKYHSVSTNSYSPHLMPPALPFDEIEDNEELQKILKYTYTGMHKILMENAALKTSKRPNAPNRVVAENNSTRFKPNLYPQLPPGWIAAAKHWDCLQNRNLGDPFKSFWTRRGPTVECSCCCNPLPNMLSNETKEKIKNSVCENKLRLPYDITKTGYGGYRQICAKGVPLEKS